MSFLVSLAFSFLCESDSSVGNTECGDCPADEDPSVKYTEPSRISRVISEIQDIKQSLILHVERKSLETAVILVAIAMTILILGSFIQWWRKGHPVLTDYVLLHPEDKEYDKDLFLKQSFKEKLQKDTKTEKIK
ncbi:hypothetical protein SNE40_014960 [Patella caerulea]|uniref:Uncharacterized protein n=1 Tax=Patella caerulea TaxID=87958 RepID=A0AAN8PUD4_PATCE